MKRQRMMKPLSNTVFMGIFGNCENNPKLEASLRGLINAILGNSRPHITQIEKVQAEDTDLGEYNGAKAIRIDLLVTDCNKSKYIIEVQLYTDLFMMKRNLVYISRIINRQLDSGDMYSKLKPVVMINIADFILFDERYVPNYYNVGNLTLKGTNYIFSHDLTFFFVELPKFKRALQSSEKSQSDNIELDQWAEYFMDYKDELKRKELSNMNAAIQSFEDEYTHMQESDDVWFKYEAERRSIEAYMAGILSAIEEAKPQIIEAAKPQIIEAAKPQIIEAAKPQIIQETRLQEKLSTARNMLNLKLDIETICAVTGLDKDVVEKI